MYRAVVVIHVLGGAVGLLSLAAPLIARKGGTVHRTVGWIFTIAMAVAATTGVLIGACWVVAGDVVKDVSDPAIVAQLRALGGFFVLLSVMAGAALWNGILAIRGRRASLPRAHAVARLLKLSVPVLGGVVLLVGALMPSVLLVGFGLLALVTGVSDVRARRDGPKAWLVAHLEAMLGAATVVLTAFLVQTVARLGMSSFAIWVWAVPIAAGNLAVFAWKRSILGRR